MDAQLSFNLDDPVDMKEHTHATKGYRYFLIIEAFTKILATDYNADEALISKYAIALYRLAGKHGVSELRAIIKNTLPEVRFD